LRYLPASSTTEALLRGTELAKAGNTLGLRARLRPKLVEIPLDDMGILAGWLKEGRMPEPGRNEILAGPESREGDHLNVSGRMLNVVGVLKPSVALFADIYLVPAHDSLGQLFPEGDSSVDRAEVIRLNEREFGDPKVHAEVAEAFSPQKFALITPNVRTDRTPFYVYLGGQALFLLGGTGLLIGLYRWLAGRVGWSVLKAPLQEMARRPRLLWGVHLAYFGLYVLGAIIIQGFPDLHTVMMAAVQGELSSQGKGPLAIAGRAYGTGNMFYAALVTFLINFPLGSFAMISLPSMIVPGCGVLLATFRATVWGLLLGPSIVSLTWGMLAHTGTLLLEGEGYILATFFALLIPVYLFGQGQVVEKPIVLDEIDDPQAAPTIKKNSAWTRFVSAVVLNLKANVLVAIVLAVAAIYEAVEVILMARL
jgi:hypothetical protein